jgi:hypothetical protein
MCKKITAVEVFDRYCFNWIAKNGGKWYGYYGTVKPEKCGTHWESTGYTRYGVPLTHFGIELDTSGERYGENDLIHRPLDMVVADRSDIGEVVLKTKDRSSTAILISIFGRRFYCVDSICDDSAIAYDKVYKVKK